MQKLLSFSFLVLYLFIAYGSPAQPTSIDQRVQALLRSINSSNASDWKVFIQDNYCTELLESHEMSHHLRMLEFMNEECGTCEIADLEIKKENLSVVFFSAKNNKEIIFDIALDIEDEDKFCGFSIEEGPSQGPVPLVDLTTKDYQEKIEQLIEKNLDLDIFSGVVLIAAAGKPIYQKAFGYADRDKKIKNTIHTLFDIGSMNKTFTKIVIQQLIHEGKLDYDDFLTTYISGFEDAKAKGITIQQLLDHQSGMGDYHDQVYFESPPASRTVDFVIDRIKQMPLLFSPGEGQEYSNSGYVILGAVIEQVTGISYFQNVRERIVKPLGLKNTHLEDLDAYKKDRAIGYYKTPFGDLHSNEKFIDHANADGGFLSTVNDIMTFYRSYYYDNLLVPEEIKSNDPYFNFLRNLPPGRAPMAAGGYNGFNTAMYQVFQDDVSIIVFSNMDEPAGEILASGILDITRGEIPENPALPAKMAVVQAYEKNGMDYVLQNFEELTRNYHPSDPKEWILNDLGYAYLFDKKDVDNAIEMFRGNTSLFPEDGNAWDSLGEAYALKGLDYLAIKCYKRALEIDPDLASSKQALTKLQKK